jgi:hypothetical protein
LEIPGVGAAVAIAFFILNFLLEYFEHSQARLLKSSQMSTLFGIFGKYMADRGGNPLGQLGGLR